MGWGPSGSGKAFEVIERLAVRGVLLRKSLSGVSQELYGVTIGAVNCLFGGAQVLVSNALITKKFLVIRGDVRINEQD